MNVKSTVETKNKGLIRAGFDQTQIAHRKTEKLFSEITFAYKL